MLGARRGRVSDGSPSKAWGFRRNVSRSKHRERAATRSLGLPEGGPTSDQPQLIVSPIFPFLVTNVGADHRLVSAHRRDEIPAGLPGPIEVLRDLLSTVRHAGQDASAPQDRHATSGLSRTVSSTLTFLTAP